MTKRAYYIINGITLYRLIAAPVLLVLIFTGQLEIFKWLLPVSFFTDAIDGFLARKYKVYSKLGAKLDSIADDLTVLAATIGLFWFKFDFITENKELLIALFVLYLIQLVISLIRYGKPSGFHTYSAKVAAVLQGVFLILIFFLPQPLYPLFYAAMAVTALDIIEEIILALLLPNWENDVKGLYWVLKRKKEK